jgi:hypothetical protein
MGDRGLRENRDLLIPDSGCAGIRLGTCTANGQDRILGEAVFGALADRHPGAGGLMKSLGLTRG